MRRSRSASERVLGAAAYGIALAGAWITFRAFGHATASMNPAVIGLFLMMTGLAIRCVRRIVYFDLITATHGGYLFDDADGEDLTDCGGGFAYLPAGPYPDDQLTFYPLDGDWYIWTCSS